MRMRMKMRNENEQLKKNVVKDAAIKESIKKTKRDKKS